MPKCIQLQDVTWVFLIRVRDSDHFEIRSDYFILLVLWENVGVH